MIIYRSIYNRLTRIEKDLEWWKNPLVNDAGGSAMCDKAYPYVIAAKKLMEEMLEDEILYKKWQKAVAKKRKK